ncbi:MAG: lamin tail domain-containing protein [Bacteroidia bacterium]
MKKIYTLLAGLFISFGATAQCTELFISEYAEGSSSNKYLELYNPSGSAIDLSNYSLYMINNGGTSNDKGFDLTGMLGANEVYVIANDAADATILALADTALGYNSVVHFNGDDAVLLIKGTDTIDQIGERWNDPGSSWTVGSGSTRDYTLVRKSSVDGPDTAWASTAAMGWDVLPKNDWTNLGSHNSTCNPLTEPASGASDPMDKQNDVVSLFSGVFTNVAVNTWRTTWSNATLEDVTIDGNDMKKYSALDFVGIEAVGANSIDASEMEYFTFDAWTPDATTYRIKLVDFGADNAYGGGDDSEHEIAFASPAQGAWTNHKINLSDFTGLTGTGNISQIIFSALPTAGATLFLDNIYFSRDEVLVYKVSSIADATVNDVDLTPTMEDTLYELTGVVYGIDYDGNDGYSFYIKDATGGVNVHSFNDVSNYVVTEGDEITARGYITFYRGLTELRVDSIKVNSQGNTLDAPIDADKPSEETESEFIKLTKVWITNDTTTVWPNGEKPNFGNVEFTNEAGDTFTVRIDKDIADMQGAAIIADTMNIVGIGSQFDPSEPYDGGYQIFPRSLADVTAWVDNSSVEELVISTRVYPNPASNSLTVAGSEKWNTYEVYNLVGVKMAEGSLNNNNLSVSDLMNGSYILVLKSNEKNGVSRFVVNK